MTTLAPVRDPRTGQTIQDIALLPVREVPGVARRSAHGFALWSRVPVGDRCELVAGIARVLAERSPEVALRFSRETGKTLAEAEVELDRAVDTLRWNAEAAERVTRAAGLPSRAGLEREISVDPAGPVLAIVPSNFPAVVLARKLGPALAMGCSVVVKAPESTPSVVLAFAAAAEAAGLPEGVLQTVFTTPEGSAALVHRPEFRTVSFTGSTRTGRLVASAAATTLAQCVLELGGHAPVIVAADADLDLAVAGLTPMKFGTAGQSCSAPSRFLVDERVHDAFVDRLVAAAPGMDFERDDLGRPGTMGPLHTSGRQKEVHSLVLDAVARGARLRLGGKPPPGPGYYYPATVLTEVPSGARVLTEEPFGPLVPIVSFNDEDKAITMANETPYGLGAFLYGAHDRMTRLARHLNAARVSINCATGAEPESPLGGRDDSGYGYEGGDQGFLAFARLKVTLRPSP